MPAGSTRHIEPLLPQTTALGTNANDTVTFTDSAVVSTSLAPRSTSDAVSVSDGGRVGETPSETVSVTEAPTRTVALPSRSGAESVAVADSIGKVARDSLTITDTAVKGKVAHDSLAFADVISRLIGRPRSGSDSVTVADAATRRVGASASDSITGPTDAAVVQGGVTRTATDSLAVSDATTRGVLNFVRTANDALTFADRATHPPSPAGLPGLLPLFVRRSKLGHH